MSLATFKDLCLDVNDLRPTTEFWADTLGLEVETFDDDPGDIALRGTSPTHRIWPCEVPEPHEVKNRVHLDVRAPSLEPFADLRRLSEPGQFPWTVFADPEGNEFCVFVDERAGGYRLKDVGVDAADHRAISQWWADVWGGTLKHDEDDDYSYLDDIPGVPFESFDFVPVAEPKTVKNRIHWDVTLTEGASVADLEAAGATVLREPDGEEIQWTVMADPEGNEFCVFDLAPAR